MWSVQFGTGPFEKLLQLMSQDPPRERGSEPEWRTGFQAHVSSHILFKSANERLLAGFG